MAVLDGAEIEHLHHVGVRQTDRELGLVDEKVRELLGFGELGENPLDDEDFLEPFDSEALGLENLGHPPAAQALQEAITAKCLIHGCRPSLASLRLLNGTIAPYIRCRENRGKPGGMPGGPR